MRGKPLRAAVLLFAAGCVTVTDTRGQLLSTQTETDNCEAELRGTYEPQLAPTVQVIVKRHVTCRKIDANTWEVIHSQRSSDGTRFGLAAIATVVTGVLAFFALGLVLAQSSQSMQPNGGGEQRTHDSEGGTIALVGAGALGAAAGTVVYAAVGYTGGSQTTTEEVDRVIDGTLSREEVVDGTLSYGTGKTVPLKRSHAQLDVAELKNADFWIGKQLVVFEDPSPFERLSAATERCKAIEHAEPALSSQYDADACRAAGWSLPPPWVAWCSDPAGCLHGMAKE